MNEGKEEGNREDELEALTTNNNVDEENEERTREQELEEINEINEGLQGAQEVGETFKEDGSELEDPENIPTTPPWQWSLRWENTAQMGGRERTEDFSAEKPTVENYQQEQVEENVTDEEERGTMKKYTIYLLCQRNKWFGT